MFGIGAMEILSGAVVVVAAVLVLRALIGR
jgi:hypothetical protein